MGRHIKNGVPYGGTVNNATMVKYGTNSTVANEIDGLKSELTVNSTTEITLTSQSVFSLLGNFYSYKVGKMKSIHGAIKINQTVQANDQICVIPYKPTVGISNIVVPTSSGWTVVNISTDGYISAGTSIGATDVIFDLSYI